MSREWQGTWCKWKSSKKQTFFQNPRSTAPFTWTTSPRSTTRGWRPAITWGQEDLGWRRRSLCTPTCISLQYIRNTRFFAESWRQKNSTFIIHIKCQFFSADSSVEEEAADRAALLAKRERGIKASCRRYCVVTISDNHCRVLFTSESCLYFRDEDVAATTKDSGCHRFQPHRLERGRSRGRERREQGISFFIL